MYVGVSVNFTVYLQNTCSLPCKFKFERPGGPHPDYEISFDPQKGSLGPKEVRFISQFVFFVFYVHCQFCFYFYFSQFYYYYALSVKFWCLLSKQSSCLNSLSHSFNHPYLLLYIHCLPIHSLTLTSLSYTSKHNTQHTHLHTDKESNSRIHKLFKASPGGKLRPFASLEWRHRLQTVRHDTCTRVLLKR